MAEKQPLPVPVPTATKADTRPDYIQRMPELPAGASVFVLTPNDSIERRATQELLEEGLYQYFETQPTENSQLKISRLPYGSVLFVAHCVTARGKRPDGTFGQIKRLHVGLPIELKNYTARSSDGYTWETDLGRVVDAVTASAKHLDGVVWLGGISGDKELDQKVVKLHRT